MDLLVSDIRKYHSAGLFSESIYSNWKKFLDTFPKEYGEIPQNKPQWPVSKMYRATSSENEPDIVVLPKIVELHQTESNPMEPVSIMHVDLSKSFFMDTLTFDPL